MATGHTARDLGVTLVHYLSCAFDHDSTSGTAISMGKLPPGAIIIDAGVTVIEAFNFGTHNVDIGDSDDPDDLATDLSLAALGIIAADELATAGDWYSASDATEMFATPTLSGGTGTTGEAIAWIAYLPPYR